MYNTIPDEIIKNLPYTNDEVSLKQYINHNIVVFCVGDIVRFTKKVNDIITPKYYVDNKFNVVLKQNQSKNISISFKISYTKKYNPKKLVATKYSLFNVLEYTDQDGIYNNEIDWIEFNHKFYECLDKINNNEL